MAAAPSSLFSMSAPPAFRVEELVSRVTDSACEARTAAAFTQALREASALLRGQFRSTRGAQRTGWLTRLAHAQAHLGADLRRKRLLELSAWAALDELDTAAPLPARLMVLPVLVEFDAKHLGQPGVMPPDLLCEAPLRRVLAEYVGSKGLKLVAAGSTLLEREGLHALGPLALREAFERAGAADAPRLDGACVNLEPDLECARTRLLLVPCSALLGENDADTGGGPPCAHAASTALREALARTGWATRQVRCLPPMPVAEALFRATGPALAELEANLACARTQWGEFCVALRFPSHCHVEVTAFAPAPAPEPESQEEGLPQEDEALVMAPFAFFEPRAMLVDAVRAACAKQGLAFRGTYSLQGTSSALLH
jgi:hypothetical protein